MSFKLGHVEEALVVIPFVEVLVLFLNAVVIGLILMFTTLFTMFKLPPKKENTKVDLMDLVLNAMMVLFLCFGMTGIMILVSNNLARAFAIGAAIALVRFRVRVDQPGFSAGLFFSVVTGMACGVDQVYTAWILAVIFCVFQISAMELVQWYQLKKKRETEINSTLELTRGMPEQIRVV